MFVYSVNLGLLSVLVFISILFVSYVIYVFFKCINYAETNSEVRWYNCFEVAIILLFIKDRMIYFSVCLIEE